MGASREGERADRDGDGGAAAAEVEVVVREEEGDKPRANGARR
jgi:hypothetical protein